MEELDTYKKNLSEHEIENERLKQELNALKSKMSSTSNLPNMETNMSYVNSNSFTNNKDIYSNENVTPFKDTEIEANNYSNNTLNYAHISSYMINRETNSNLLVQGNESPNIDNSKMSHNLNENSYNTGNTFRNINNMISPLIHNNVNNNNYCSYSNFAEKDNNAKQFSLNFGRLYDEKQKLSQNSNNNINYTGNSSNKNYKSENPYIYGIQNNVKYIF